MMSLLQVLERNCDTPGPTVCETVFESECKTSYHVHEVEEDKPNCTIQMVVFLIALLHFSLRILVQN